MIFPSFFNRVILLNVEVLLQVAYTTLMGRCLDILLTNFGKKPNLDLFTMDQFNSLANWKTAYYTFHFPVTAAMNLVSTTVFLHTKRLIHFDDNDKTLLEGWNKRPGDV